MRYRFRTALIWATALPLLALASALQAQTDPTDQTDRTDPSDQTFSDEIVVTAKRLPSLAETVGSSVTVIDQEEIERRHETSVLDLLRTVPGLEVSRTGGPGAVASVFIRGASSNHTLVLIDGVRAINTSGGFDFSGLDADNVERIEVLRGPQSTLYGSEAIGGVISITTRRGRPGFHASLDARAGSLDTREGRLVIDGGSERFDYSLSVSDRRTDGVSAASTASELRGNTEEDPFSDQTVSGRFSVGLPASGRLDLVARHVDSESSLDGFTIGVGPTDDLNFTQKRRVSVASLQLFQPVASRMNLRVHASASQDESRLRDPDTDFNNADFESRVGEISAQSDFTLTPSDTLVVGVSKERRQGETASAAYDESLDVDSAWIENDWSWRERLHVTAGARYDRYAGLGEETTYRVTGSYVLSAWRLLGSVGTGFRGPSFDELFFPFAGNPDLEPESSRGWDAGVERSFLGGTVTAGVTWFENRFRDLIAFDFTTFTFANVRQAESRGAEASLRVRPRKEFGISAIVAAYTYNDTEDLDTGLPLARRPKHRLSLTGLFEPVERFQGSASLVAVRDRIDSDGTEMDDYERLDLSLEYQIRPWLAPYLQLENVLDADYEEVNGYAAPGFVGFLGIRFRYQ